MKRNDKEQKESRMRARIFGAQRRDRRREVRQHQLTLLIESELALAKLERKARNERDPLLN